MFARSYRHRNGADTRTFTYAHEAETDILNTHCIKGKIDLSQPHTYDIVHRHKINAG